MGCSYSSSIETRVCGDYHLTINHAAKPDTYPLPQVEDLFATLARGKSFSKLDLAHAYSQIPLADASKQYVTVNTHKGLYWYNRLPFGIIVFYRNLSNGLWEAPQKAAFTEAKRQLSSQKLFVHSDPSKELLLSCDASPYGIISSRGTEQPIAFISRSLLKAELNYAHLDEEGLAIVTDVYKSCMALH